MRSTRTLITTLGLLAIIAIANTNTVDAHEVPAPKLGVLELPFGGDTPEEITVRNRKLHADGSREVQYFIPFGVDMKALKDRVDADKKSGYTMFSAITMVGAGEDGTVYDYSSTDPTEWQNGVNHALHASTACDHAGIHRLGFAGAFGWSVRVDDTTTGPEFQAHVDARWAQFKLAFQTKILPHVAKQKTLRSVHPELLNGFENMGGKLGTLLEKLFEVETPEFIESNGGRRLLGPLFDSAHWHKDDACRELLYALFAFCDYHDIVMMFHLSPPNRTEIIVIVRYTERKAWTIDVDGIGAAMIANGFADHSVVIEVFQLNPPFLNGGGLVAGSPSADVMQSWIAEAIKDWPRRWAEIPDAEIAKARTIRAEVFKTLNAKTGWNKRP